VAAGYDRAERADELRIKNIYLLSGACKRRDLSLWAS
jgi:hypothetical protein